MGFRDGIRGWCLALLGATYVALKWSRLLGKSVRIGQGDRMKLALVVRRLSLNGGTERFVAGFARHAHAAGHRLMCGVLGLTSRSMEWWLKTGPVGTGAVGTDAGPETSCAAIPREDDRVMGLLLPRIRFVSRGWGCHAAWLEVSPTRLADRVELKMDREAVQTAGVVVVNLKWPVRISRNTMGCNRSVCT